MKTILRNIILYSLILFILPILIPGVSVGGGILTFLTGGVVLTLLFLILKPVLSILSFPVNMVTLGFFNIFINALLFYLLTVFVAEISVSAFTYSRMDILGIIIPSLTFNTFFAYLYTAFVLSVIDGTIKWLIR